MAAVLEKVRRAVNRMKHRNGPKLIYAEIFDSLVDEQLYSVYMIRKFAVNNGLLKPGPDDPLDMSTKKLEERLRCALGRARSATYNGRRLPEPDGLIKDRGKIEHAWLGATIKLFLLDQWPKEQAKLRRVRRKYLARKERGRIAAWVKRPRVWIGVAAFLALACTTPPGRDIIGTMITKGVAAARELAYSVPATTPEALFQQAWIDYRSGDYETAAQKAYSILSNEKVAEYTQANCWYLLGSVDWETGSSDAALGNLRKAYDLYEASRDIQNMYQTSLAMAKVDISIDDYEASNERLQAALSLYDLDGGKHIPHLGEYHAAAIELATRLRDSVAGLKHARRRHEIYQGGVQLDILADAESNLGFWYAANGCPVQAQLHTVEAARIIFKLNDERRFVYNELNWVLIYRLEGVRSDSGVLGIKEWAGTRGDSRLEDLLDLALTLEPAKEYADEKPCHESLEPE